MAAYLEILKLVMAAVGSENRTQSSVEIDTLTDAMIAFVLDESKQESLRKERKSIYDKMVKDAEKDLKGKPLHANVELEFHRQTAMVIAGKVNAWFDRYLGHSENRRIGIISSFTKIGFIALDKLPKEVQALLTSYKAAENEPLPVDQVEEQEGQQQ
jgi:hypothetical protein